MNYLPKWQLLPYVISRKENTIVFKVYEIAGDTRNVNIMNEITKAIRLMIIKSLVEKENLVIVQVDWVSAGVISPMMTCHDARRLGSHMLAKQLAYAVGNLDFIKRDNTFVVKILNSNST